MKYIRTKDGVYLIMERIGSEWHLKTTDYKNGIKVNLKENEYKLADTIEELCDEFVYVGLECPKVIDAYHNYKFIDIKQVRINIELHGGCLFGAIWTDKGLIYVAKMNDEGSLELL